MREERIGSWEEFQQLINTIVTEPAWATNSLFRGQAYSKWGLEPSLSRLFSETIEELDALNLEHQAVKWFQARAHNYLKANELLEPNKQLPSWWALMQQHGAPTRLLDWTASPYVAAYFAVRDAEELDGAIWIAFASEINRVLAETYGQSIDQFLARTSSSELYLAPDRPREVIFITRSQLLERMVPQQSYFSVCRNVLGEQQKAIEDVGTYAGHNYLVKLIIPAGLKREFLRNLRVMNVTGSSLFPGLDGLGLDVKELLKLCL